jgi:hypothetical protein
MRNSPGFFACAARFLAFPTRPAPYRTNFLARRTRPVAYRTKLLVLLLACASSAVVVRAQSVPPKPGPEVRKLAVMVGRFTVEDEVKAGAMGPNSAAKRYGGTDDCRWTSGGFAVICDFTLDSAGVKYTGTTLVYYDPVAKVYRLQEVDSSGEIDIKTGTVSGDTWTWPGETILHGKVYHARYIMKVVSADSYEYTEESGEDENSMTVLVTGRETRVAANRAATVKPGE